MVRLADIAARLCSRDLSDISETPISSGLGRSPRPGIEMCTTDRPRTKAALAAKVLAIKEAVRVQ